MPGAQIIARQLDMVIVSIESESALEKGILAILYDEHARPPSFLPAVSSLSACDPCFAFEHSVLQRIQLAGMMNATTRHQMRYSGVSAQNHGVRFQYEFDVLVA